MRSERGSVTLFVLVAMIFFLVIAMTAYVSASVKLQGENEEIARIKASYEQDMNAETLLEIYNKVTKTRDWLGGKGTENNKYKIYTIEDLVTLSIRSNSGDFKDKYIYVELMNDLDFKRDSSYENAYRTDFGNLNGDDKTEGLKTELTTGTGFPCIAVTEANAFNGTFEGNEHEINNLYINNNDSSISALFSYVKNAKIENLGISGKCIQTNSTAAGIIGIGEGNTNIKGCYNNADITKNGTSSNVAGIIGVINEESNISIENCYNTGKITMSGEEPITAGWGNTGGLIGIVNGNVTISNSYNTGTIESEYGYHTGGLIARDSDSVLSSIKIINCYNTGNIISKRETGGLIGYVLKDAVIINSYNSGNITGELFHSGGIIANAIAESNLKINNVFNTGLVNDNNKDGIIFACSGNKDVRNCYYENNNTYNGFGSTSIDVTKLEQAEIKNASFVNTLNTNKNNINLSDYGISNYTLSSWKQGANGYPEFDW